MNWIDGWPLEELRLFEPMEWAHDSLDDSIYRHSIKKTIEGSIWVRQREELERNPMPMCGAV
jgi:hypothetical protein